MKLDDVYNEFLQKMISEGYSQNDIVFGNGNVDADVVLIGEAPGKEEVEKKIPFVGKAGKILDEFLEKTGIKRHDLFVTNTVKFRPYKISEKGTVSNRPPTVTEIELCANCLENELVCISPKLIITLGNVPLKSILADKKVTIGDYHGRLVNTPHGKLFPLYHPASIIYNRSLKSVYEKDLEMLSSII